jgi:hypothetical protein
MRILFLGGRENPLYNAHRNLVEGVHATRFFASDTRLAKLARRIVTHLPGVSVAPFFHDWIGRVDEFDLIIISGTIYSNAIGQALIARGLKDKLVHWFWNPVAPADQIVRLQAQGVPIYSFDPSDARRYRLRLETTYYFASLYQPGEDAGAGADIFFVGGDKGRLAHLLSVKAAFERQGLSTHFHIVDTGHRPAPSGFRFAPPMAYSGVLDALRQARCVLDVVQQGQTGLTQRPLEALFHRKKLITNDPALLAMDFYCPENIFVLGHDDPAALPAFVHMPLRTIAPAILERYDFANWVARVAAGARAKAAS